MESEAALSVGRMRTGRIKRRLLWALAAVALVVLLVAVIGGSGSKDNGPDVLSVRCPTTAICLGVGWYRDKAGDARAMTMTEINGIWGSAKEVDLPPNAAQNPDAYLEYVRCPSDRFCTAVGKYTDRSGRRGIITVDEFRGVWRAAREVPLPANAAG